MALKEALNFLKFLFNGTNGYVEFRGIKKGSVYYRNFVPASKVGEISLPCMDDIFFGVCTRRSKTNGTKRNIKEVPALWADIDREDRVYGIDRVPLPTIIVRSGKGFHLYWKLRFPAKADSNVETILKGLTEVISADRSATDITRMLRLPGTYNTKYEPPVLVKVVNFNRVTYSLNEFQKYSSYKPVYDSFKDRKRFFYPLQLVEIVIKNCQFIQWASTNQNDVKEPLWWAMITNLVCFENSEKLIHSFSCLYSGYTRKETDYKIRHGLRMAPLTCMYIYRNGYTGCLSCSFWGKIIAPVSLVSYLRKRDATG